MDPSSATLSRVTYRREFDMAGAEQYCYAAGECVGAEPLVSVALVVVTGLATFFAAAVLLHVDRAWSLLEKERERTRAERDAFEEFASRVAALDPAPPEASIGSSGSVQALIGSQSGRQAERVREAYRETVMAVSHYEEEYDEPLEANMTAELGAELAAAVAEGTTFTSHLQRALIAGSKDATVKRDELLQRLDREAANLADAEAELTDVADDLADVEATAASNRRFDDLLETWDRIGELESRCRSLLTDRQETLHDRERGAGDAPSIQEYLYRPLDVDYPVLAAGTTLVERAAEARRQVEAALAGRS